METNFDYLLKKEEYADFAKQAVEAEKVYPFHRLLVPFCRGVHLSLQ